MFMEDDPKNRTLWMWKEWFTDFKFLKNSIEIYTKTSKLKDQWICAKIDRIDFRDEGKNTIKIVLKDEPESDYFIKAVSMNKDIKVIYECMFRIKGQGFEIKNLIIWMLLKKK
jgi:hypothetical protein